MAVHNQETFELGEGSGEAEESADNNQGKETPLKTFLDNSSMHALPFIRSLTGVRQILWIILMLSCTVTLMETTISAFTKFMDLQSVISITTQTDTMNGSIRFPVVTICNRNMLRKSRITGTYSQTFLDILDPLKQDKMNQTNVTSPIDYKDYMKDAHTISDMLVECTWNGKNCDPNNFTVNMVSDLRFGVCYSFNSKFSESEALYSSKPSPMNGLTLTLNAQPEEYYGPFSKDGTGFRIIVSDKNESVQVQQNGLDVSPGFRTEISFTKVIAKRLPAPFLSNCSSEKIRAYGQEVSYTVATCYELCYLREVSVQCKCKLFQFGAVTGEQRVCNPKDYRDCAFPLHDTLNRWICKCPPPCTQVDYLVQTSLSYYPSEHAWPDIMTSHGFNVTDDKSEERFKSDYRKKYARVLLFYRSLTTKVIKEQEMYDEHALIADIGGNMGVFLGCSMLTLYEFLDLMCTCFFQFVKRRFFHRVNTVNQVQPGH